MPPPFLHGSANPEKQQRRPISDQNRYHSQSHIGLWEKRDPESMGVETACNVEVDRGRDVPGRVKGVLTT